MISSQPPLLPCYMVNNLTKNSLEQCKFIIDNDCLEDESVIDYVYLVYCEFGHELRYLSMILIVFLVIVLFLALSAVADEFLCPSLLAVAKNLRMSDSLAGVTLLAFGNGCPDIFSSLAAASDDRSELIVGELLGAGIFCTSIVSGIIFIHSDFKLACRPILRDTTFYLLAVYLIWFYCWSQAITFYGSLAFILIYVIYLIVALGGQAIHSRLQGNYAIAETQAELDHQEKHNNENWFKWREESLRRRNKIQREKMVESVPINSIEYNSRQLRQSQQFDHVTTIHLGSESFHSSDKRMPLELQIYSSPHQTNSSKSRSCSYVNEAFVLDDGNYCAKSTAKSKQKHNKKSDMNFKGSLDMVPVIVKYDDDLTSNEWDDFLCHVNPIDSKNWHLMSFSAKLFSILRAPLHFAARITVPVVDQDKRINNWCRLLNSLHCITVPLTLTTTTRTGWIENLSLFGLPLPVLILIPGIISAAFVLKTTKSNEPPKYQPVFAYFGFIMSILWIYLLATEIISLLKTVGIMFSMSDTAIGLGVLAWGNSLGDIVANVSLADAGYPRMAIGASIGAPLLNLLLGFGLSFTYSLKPGQFSTVKYSPTITLLCSTLAIILISLMLCTLASPEKSKKPFGYLLIACYGIYFLIAVCLEYGIINF